MAGEGQVDLRGSGNRGRCDHGFRAGGSESTLKVPWVCRFGLRPTLVDR